MLSRYALTSLGRQGFVESEAGAAASRMLFMVLVGALLIRQLKRLWGDMRTLAMESMGEDVEEVERLEALGKVTVSQRLFARYEGLEFRLNEW